uniref:Ovule protein n=1 Tax=Bursaphelenchus xylophilus TaxID=6326 RepID=A0A1I7RJC9_BURXY
MTINSPPSSQYHPELTRSSRHLRFSSSNGPVKNKPSFDFDIGRLQFLSIGTEIYTRAPMNRLVNGVPSSSKFCRTSS